jgi:hypothetical protein
LPAAAITAWCRKLLGSRFAFGSFGFFGAAALADDANDDRVVRAVLDELDALRQLDLGQVNGVADVECREIDFDEGRQILGQAMYVEFGDDVVDQAAVELSSLTKCSGTLMCSSCVASTRWKSTCRISGLKA